MLYSQAMVYQSEGEYEDYSIVQVSVCCMAARRTDIGSIYQTRVYPGLISVKPVNPGLKKKPPGLHSLAGRG